MWSVDQLERGAETETRPAIAILAPALLALLVGTMIVIGGYFTTRRGGVDEIGLYNPVYMLLHYGRMTYPIHGYFDAMFVHPPVHYLVIAGFMKAGLPLFYAEATPLVVTSLAILVLVVRSSFDWPLKCGLILGLYAPVAFFASRDSQWEPFGMRPETQLAMAFLLGLVLLERARLERWDQRKVFFGSLVLTYASGLHYYAVAAILGLLVYAGYAVRERGWREARPILLTLALGSAVFGVPYVWMFVWPHVSDILTLVRQVEAGSGTTSPFQLHLLQYRYWVMNGFGPPWIQWVIGTGCPTVAVSTLLLLVCAPRHRALVLASLPLQLYILLFARHKSSGYFAHEIQLYTAAVITAALVVAERLTARIPVRRLQPVMLLVGVSVIAAGFVDRPTLTSRTRFRAFFHYGEIARAAAREMLGDNARVGGHLGLWYAAGAVHWYGIDPDVLWIRRPSVNFAAYLSRFDAIAESTHMSNVTLNEQGHTVSSWYADGTLGVRGFFFSGDDPDLSYLLFAAQPPPKIVGYASDVNGTFRYDQDDRGDYTLASFACPKPGPSVQRLKHTATWSQILYLPPDLSSYVITALGDAVDLQRVAVTADECRPILRATLRKTPADADAMVADLRQHDRTVRFYSSFDAFPDDQGRPADVLGDPPSGEVTPLPGVLLLEAIATSYNKARITRHGAVTVSTGPGMGAFGAFIPLKPPTPTPSQAWIRLRLRVTSGHVSVAAYDQKRSEYVTQSFSIGPSGRMLNVYLYTDRFEDVHDVIIQGNEANTSSEVEIEEAAVLVRAKAIK